MTCRMDLKVEQVINNLFSEDAYESCDAVNPEDLQIELPEWFDEKKYNQGRRFQKDFFFVQSISMILGLISILSIPTILSVLVGSRHSNSEYTAFKRYWSTFLHLLSWYDHDLKPNSVSWKSLLSVRSRHIMSDRAAKLKGHGRVSQRDVALTIFGFMGFSVLKPDRLCIRALQPGDWDAFVHFWAVIGYMLGLDDRCNICRRNFHETRQICRYIQDKVFTPCLTNPPEYFEHAAHVMTTGMSTIHAAIEHEALVYVTKNFSNVPGYIYTEEDRLALEVKLSEQQNRNKYESGVPMTHLIDKCPIDFPNTPPVPPTVLHPKDYQILDNSPQYKRLALSSKFKLAVLDIILGFYKTYIGRVILNLHFSWCIFLGTYFPYVSMWRYGVTKAYVNIFKDGPADNFAPLPNSKYYNRKPKSWYKDIWDCIFWGQSD